MKTRWEWVTVGWLNKASILLDMTEVVGIMSNNPGTKLLLKSGRVLKVREPFPEVHDKWTRAND